MNVQLSGSPQRPVFDLEYENVEQLRFLRVHYAKDASTSEVLWEVDFAKALKRVEYGQQNGVAQYFPRDGASPQDVPEDKVVFVRLAYVYKGSASMSGGRAGLCFVVRDGASRILSDNECREKWVPPPRAYLEKRLHGREDARD